MMSKNEKYPMCHIYGQKDWHDEVCEEASKVDKAFELLPNKIKQLD